MCIEHTCELFSGLVNDSVVCTAAILYGLYHCSSIWIIIHTYVLCTSLHKSILCCFVCVYLIMVCQMRTFCSIQWSMVVSGELGRIRSILNSCRIFYCLLGIQRTVWFLNPLTLTYLDCCVRRARTYCIRVWCARSVACERQIEVCSSVLVCLS